MNVSLCEECFNELTPMDMVVHGAPATFVDGADDEEFFAFLDTLTFAPVHKCSNPDCEYRKELEEDDSEYEEDDYYE